MNVKRLNAVSIKRLEAVAKQNRNAERIRLIFAFVILVIFTFYLFTFSFLTSFSHAERTETKDRIIYGTDPEMERAMDDQAREEKEKEAKAWNMLQNMGVYQDNGKHRRPPRKEKRRPKPYRPSETE